jgi:F420-0:gamma-glutamyl ligase
MTESTIAGSPAQQEQVKMKTILRQGDVLMISAELPKDAAEVSIKGDVILKHGEATGHMHSFRGEDAAKVRMWHAGAERYIQVLERTSLLHEEHGAVIVEPGIYYLPEQVSYERGEIQRVAD